MPLNNGGKTLRVLQSCCWGREGNQASSILKEDTRHKEDAHRLFRNVHDAQTWTGMTTYNAILATAGERLLYADCNSPKRNGTESESVLGIMSKF